MTGAVEPVASGRERLRMPIRWGIPDALIVWVVAAFVSVIATVPFTSQNAKGNTVVSANGVVVSIIVQAVAIVGICWAVAQWKGRGSLRADFGLTLRARDAGWLGAGVVAAIVAGLISQPLVDLLNGGHTVQEVTKQLQDSKGLTLFLFALAVVVAAPVAEELLFRGLLLRSLLRRFTPAVAIVISALVFGLVHILGDPGSYPALPALTALGILNAVLAYRSGSLSRSIFVHAGFNLLQVLAVIAR
ncbi:MAG: putative metal-dependent rane protease [Actinomycetia bacterium]|nr:putative metal-dependent rane protease [Actinomycetes bacterium]